MTFQMTPFSEYLGYYVKKIILNEIFKRNSRFFTKKSNAISVNGFFFLVLECMGFASHLNMRQKGHWKIVSLQSLFQVFLSGV